MRTIIEIPVRRRNRAAGATPVIAMTCAALLPAAAHASAQQQRRNGGGFSVALMSRTRAQDEGLNAAPVAKVAEDTDKALLDLSKRKWTWMSDRNGDALEALFHEKAVFVHMGGSMMVTDDGSGTVWRVAFTGRK